MDNEDIKIIEDDYTAEELHRLFLTYLRCQEHIKGMTSSPEQADLMEMVELAGEYICECNCSEPLAYCRTISAFPANAAVNAS